LTDLSIEPRTLLNSLGVADCQTIVHVRALHPVHFKGVFSAWSNPQLSSPSFRDANRRSTWFGGLLSTLLSWDSTAALTLFRVVQHDQSLDYLSRVSCSRLLVQMEAFGTSSGTLLCLRLRPKTMPREDVAIRRSNSCYLL
jgi:hypothetical protein